MMRETASAPQRSLRNVPGRYPRAASNGNSAIAPEGLQGITHCNFNPRLTYDPKRQSSAIRRLQPEVCS
jgi:hypothetical protein